MGNNWHSKTISDILKDLNSSERGLSKEEVDSRFKKYGANKLPEAKTDSLPVIFLRQFESPLIYILLAASAIVFGMGENIDGSVILAVLIFNAIAGTIQEGRAQNTLLALKKFTETSSTVLRDGKEFIVPASEIVQGDIIILQEGEQVPADSRVISSNNLKIDEAALTGDSIPIYKDENIILKASLPTTDQKNMVFKGTHVVYGNAKAVAVNTGADTIIGKISKEIAVIDTEIPLKADIRRLSQLIVITVLCIGIALFIAGVYSGKSLQEMFITIVALLVSIIPEGLPIVITLVLATGVWRMSKQNALVKKLQAVEALGQAKVIAVDKTGTITKNELMVKNVYLPSGKLGSPEKLFVVGGIGYEPKGQISVSDLAIDPLNYPDLLFAGKVAALCSNARVMFSEEDKLWHVSGDPTEAAMIVLSEKIGFHKEELEREIPRVFEIPFDYKSKFHASIHKLSGKKILFVTGAPEVILSLSNKVRKNGKNLPLKKEEKEKFEADFLKMSKDGMRVVAMASKYGVQESILPESVNELVFVGFLGMIDALKPKIFQSIKKANSAGIKVVMITGDHKNTARTIAREAGIYKEGDEVLLGQEIDLLSEKELSNKIIKVSVFARVTPEHKLRIVQAYKRNGEVVAMTGDGVNDAPSLVAADLGISMGKIGTEVAKEASDIVLLDDNFESIISAVEEGRSIYKTIKKVILYLFSTSLGEVLTIAAAIFLGYPLPIIASQIIWLNFITDGFLVVALALEPKEKNLLERSFKRPQKYLIDKLMAFRMVIMALPMTIGTLFLFRFYFETDMIMAWTISLTTLAVFQWFNIWNCRSEEKSIFKTNPFSNKFLFAATAIVIFLQILAVYNPFLNKILRTSPLDLKHWALIIIISSSIILVEEIRKFFYRKSLSKEKFEK